MSQSDRKRSLRSRYRLWRRSYAPLLRVLHRLMPILSFLAGVASFALIERGEVLAKWLAGLLIASWVLLVLEPLFARIWRRSRGYDFPPVIIRFAAQAVHQESLFFVLPFFWATTNWDTGQAFFTALLILAALVSVLDPLYFQRLAARRFAYLAYHALAMFVGMLTAGPIVWQLTTMQSLQIALAAAALAALSGIPLSAKRQPLHMHLLIFAGVLLICAGLWFGRIAVPPSTLWVTDASVSVELSVSERRPVKPTNQLASSVLSSQGLYAFAAIRAPRGLSESVFHEWRRNGEMVDRIELQLHGGREQGYRAWSHKRNFSDNPAGKWEVRVMTAGGQLISSIRFVVD